MSYKIISTQIFLKQVLKLNNSSKKLLEKKIQLLKNNPIRFKSLKGHNPSLFRIRFKDQRKEKRLIYLVEDQKIILICILDRSKNYKDLEKYLS